MTKTPLLYELFGLKLFEKKGRDTATIGEFNQFFGQFRIKKPEARRICQEMEDYGVIEIDGWGRIKVKKLL
jgi:DUF2075 family protein